LIPAVAPALHSALGEFTTRSRTAISARQVLLVSLIPLASGTHRTITSRFKQLLERFESTPRCSVVRSLSGITPITGGEPMLSVSVERYTAQARETPGGLLGTGSRQEYFRDALGTPLGWAGVWGLRPMKSPRVAIINHLGSPLFSGLAIHCKARHHRSDAVKEIIGVVGDCEVIWRCLKNPHDDVSWIPFIRTPEYRV